MDGTIFDTEKIALEAWGSVLDAKGYKNGRATVMQCIGKNSRETNAILRETYGDDFPVDTLRAEKNSIMHEHIENFGLTIKDGIEDTIKWMAYQSIPNAIASSSDRSRITTYLDQSGLRKYFDVIVGGDQVTKGKPDPEIFQVAAKELGMDPGYCIVFEDSHHGVMAAHRANMRVVMIPDLIEATEEIKTYMHHQLTSGKEIISLLTEILRPTSPSQTPPAPHS